MCVCRAGANGQVKTSGNAAAETLYIVRITGQEEAWEAQEVLGGPGGVRQELPPCVCWWSHPPAWEVKVGAGGVGVGLPRTPFLSKETNRQWNGG